MYQGGKMCDDEAFERDTIKYNERGAREDIVSQSIAMKIFCKLSHYGLTLSKTDYKLAQDYCGLCEKHSIIFTITGLKCLSLYFYWDVAYSQVIRVGISEEYLGEMSLIAYVIPDSLHASFPSDWNKEKISTFINELVTMLPLYSARRAL